MCAFMRFRQRAALFGHNAPDPNVITVRPAAIAGLPFDEAFRWTKSGRASRFRMALIDLDSSYSKIVAGSLARTQPSAR